MRRLAIWITAISMLLAGGSAQAAGVGFYGDIGGQWPTGNGVWNGNEWSLGLAIDSNLAQDKLFNYRTDIGYHRNGAASTSVLGAGDGASWNQVFGFGVLRSEYMRLYLGPAVRVTVDWYNVGSTVDAQFGVGPQAGLNFHLGDHASLSATLAYNYRWGWLVPTSSIFALAGTTMHEEHYFGASFAIFFRGGGDTFK